MVSPVRTGRANAAREANVVRATVIKKVKPVSYREASRRSARRNRTHDDGVYQAAGLISKI
jgi:hypothetical protein